MQHKWTLSSRMFEKTVSAADPVLAFTQIHIDACGKAAAENITHAFDGDIVGRATTGREFSGQF